jgi:carbamoyltransferase
LPNLQEHLEAYTEKPFSNKVLSYLGYTFPKMFAQYESLKEPFVLSKKRRRVEHVRSELAHMFDYPASKIIFIDHHLAHAFSTCFNASKSKKTLVFTLDGEGSGLCATVNIWDGMTMKTIARTPKSASLGYLYSVVTMMLGMKPLEHEFKVMGLAPYAKEHNLKKPYDKIKHLIRVNNNLEFESAFNMPFADNFFQREMKFQRFDNMSAAVQKLVEELMCEWIVKSIEKTGISDIAVSGGVFMNVKANMKIAALSQVKSMFIVPSSGDESNPIGCCFYGYRELCKRENVKLAAKPLGHLYLGPEYDDDYIANFIKERDLSKKYSIQKVKNINQKIATLLASGEIVARCTGKSEWGARALGNRSILANPARGDTIRILNETIKDRDFWMPFTPSMIDSSEKSYVINPKKMPAPYMVLTFDSTKKAQEQLPAAMHPYDFTVRPQIVTRAHNKDYYEIIQTFSKLTGTGAVLNTSFNLHGEPNVLTPEDAIHTVDNSSLKYLAMGNYLFVKK